MNMEERAAAHRAKMALTDAPDPKAVLKIAQAKSLLDAMEQRNNTSRSFDPELAADLAKLQLWLAQAEPGRWIAGKERRIYD